MLPSTKILLVSALVIGGTFAWSTCGSGMISSGDYTIGAGVTCESCPENCDSCTMKNGEIVCSECGDGYYLDADLSCSACYENCKVCAGPDLADCIVTADGYGYNPDEETIEECTVGGCSFCPDSTVDKCYAECTDGYYETGDYNDGEIDCTTCGENCDSCIYYSDGNASWWGYSDAFLMCTQCADGYAIDYSSGLESCTDACGDNCYLCSGSELAYCYACQDGYQSNSSGGCDVDSSYISSSDCEIGEFASDGECDSCGSNCLECFGSTYCYDCDEGYYEDGIGSCVACGVENCGNCDYFGELYCYVCADGYTNDWSFSDGTDYTTCVSCSSFDENCISCDLEYGVCEECAEGYVWDSETESCVDCEIEFCVSCDTVGGCSQCADGYYPTPDTCVKCDSSCATCHGGSATACSTCPLAKWSFYTPYERVGVTDSIYGNFGASRAPNFSTNWNGFSLQCVDECTENLSGSDEIVVDETLRSCWVETNQEDLDEKVSFLKDQSLALERTADILLMMEWIYDSIETEQYESSGITTDYDNEDQTYLRKRSQDFEDDLSRLSDECYFNGVNDTNIDPIGRIAVYCDCTNEDGEPLFYGVNCEYLFSFKAAAEERVRETLEAALAFEVTTHHEAFDLLVAVSSGTMMDVLSIQDVASAAERFQELIGLIDRDLYPTILDDLVMYIPRWSNTLSYNVISQLSLPDKNYEWDEPSTRRRLVGSQTVEDMRSSLYSLMDLSEYLYSNMDEIKSEEVYSEGTGVALGVITVSSNDAGDWLQWCPTNYIGKFEDGFNQKTGQYNKKYVCKQFSYFSDGSTSDEIKEYYTGVYINSDLVGAKLFIADISQFIGVYITETERAVTNLLFVGAKDDSGEDIGTSIEFELAVAYEFPGDYTDIACGLLISNSDTGMREISSDVTCEIVASEDEERIECNCDAGSGWVVGYITSDYALELIETQASEGQYEVAFAARAVVSIVLGLIYVFLA